MMVLRLTSPLYLIQNLITISKEYSVTTAPGGGREKIQYISQDHADFIITGLHRNAGYTIHTTL